MRSTEHYGNRTRQPDRQTARRHAFTYHRRNPAHNDIAIPEYIREISDRKSLPAQGLICSNIKIQEQSHEITYNPFNRCYPDRLLAAHAAEKGTIMIMVNSLDNPYYASEAKGASEKRKLSATKPPCCPMAKMSKAE